MKKILMLCAAATMLAGCAAPATSASTEEVQAREYPTGSNIPRKRAPGSESASEQDREALERARSQMPSAPRPGIPGSTPGG